MDATLGDEAIIRRCAWRAQRGIGPGLTRDDLAQEARLALWLARRAGRVPTGAGTAMIVESNDAGAAAAWWCKATSKAKGPTLYLYAVRWESLTTAMLADAALVGLSGAKAAGIQAHLLKYQTSNIRDMCDVWGPARERILAAKPLQ